jgi:ubiquinone/menaquinone biosynthesis C-methylase UbiE
MIMDTVKSERVFLPAAGRDIFLPLYDPFTRLLGADRAREALLEQGDLQPYQRVLDLGCGTGTLAVLIKRRHPTVEVIGLDPDPKALARARAKAERAGVSIRFDRAFSDSLGYADDTFDRVFSSLMLHHLPAASRPATLREVRRVLRPGGRLEVLDFAGPHAARHRSVLARLIHSHHQLKENDEDRVLGLMTDAGLTPQVTARRGSLFGRLVYYQALK